jgi:hypothetical protein
MGYIRDSVWSIWNNAPGSCVGCHAGATVPVLNDGADTTHLTSWGSIRGTSGVVILDPQPDPLASLLHICPTFTAGCVSGNPSTHPGGMKFAVGSLEDNAIVRWITDGALF